ncbi:hypothetical protein VA7868_04611 [Vibrio aerogenes CECT 7868]|uniref:Uncharacterized protein n=1 Tax=Vibrio aerogenes CECT 7868 TaxID=1216006 RepID=A0A1M6FAS2_9VIBR|nr:hypothetical protein [Vibrio aerogenes]SHI94772.1 hypothetical protein VA7868_04611 [Vibrio aerogenes CECT 7868]
MIPNLNNSGTLDGGDTSSGLSNYSGGLTVGDMYVNSKRNPSVLWISAVAGVLGVLFLITKGGH